MGAQRGAAGKTKSEAAERGVRLGEMRRVLSSWFVVVCAGACACSGAQPREAPVIVSVSDAGAPPPIRIGTRETADEEPPLAKAPSPADPIDPARDLRKSAASPRKAALLDTEMSALERLLAATPAGATDRPALLRRVAESASELGYARERDATGDPRAARARAIDAYETLLRDYPSYAQRDEADYYLGLERERAGDVSKARRAYYELIANSPQSKYVPLAYFAFGEMFYREGASDPSKLDLARQAYVEVTKYPAPANTVHDLAKERIDAIRRRAAP
jgi:tetratricopeptide (TPR) repeat protein